MRVEKAFSELRLCSTGFSSLKFISERTKNIKERKTSKLILSAHIYTYNRSASFTVSVTFVQKWFKRCQQAKLGRRIGFNHLQTSISALKVLFSFFSWLHFDRHSRFSSFLSFSYSVASLIQLVKTLSSGKLVRRSTSILYIFNKTPFSILKKKKKLERKFLMNNQMKYANCVLSSFLASLLLRDFFTDDDIL